MMAFEKSLEKGLIPWLKGAKILRRNTRLSDSLIDYLIKMGDEKVYLEVKSAVLRDGSYAMYPDCPSLRGRRHIKELTSLVQEGGKAIILFVAALPEVEAFQPNKAADPELCELLMAARRTGVVTKAIEMVYQPGESAVYLLSPDLPVALV